MFSFSPLATAPFGSIGKKSGVAYSLILANGSYAITGISSTLNYHAGSLTLGGTLTLGSLSTLGNTGWLFMALVAVAAALGNFFLMW